MQHLPATWLLALLNGAVVLAAAGVAGYVLTARSGGDDDLAGWGDGARELACEVRRAAEPQGTPADPDRVARRLLPLASRIQSHVRAAPASADAGVYRQLFDLGVACQHVAVEQPPDGGRVEGPFLEDRLATLADQARALESAVESG